MEFCATEQECVQLQPRALTPMRDGRFLDSTCSEMNQDCKGSWRINNITYRDEPGYQLRAMLRYN